MAPLCAFFICAIAEHASNGISAYTGVSFNQSIMKISTHSTIYTCLIFCAVLLVLPAHSFAATARPSCELLVSTPYDSIEIDDKETILLPKGETLGIAWTSKNAREAFDDRKKSIDLDGMATFTPSRSTTYTYKFENGSKRETCEVSVKIATGSFESSSLSSMSSKPLLSGKASGLRKVQVYLYKENSTKPFFISKVLKVKKGKWSTKVTKSLPDGAYSAVLVGEKDMPLNTLSQETLTIGEPANTSATIFAVEAVPLLNGTVARAGSAIPISYLQVINIGKEAGNVEHFEVMQNGSAPTSAIVGFVVMDNRSTTTTAVGSVLKPITFKNGKARIPVDIAINPGQMRLFTIKAVLAPNLSGMYFTQLKLDIASVETNAKERGAFPIKGTTWMLGW